MTVDPICLEELGFLQASRLIVLHTMAFVVGAAFSHCSVAACVAVIFFLALVASLRFWTSAAAISAIYWLFVQIVVYSLGGNSNSPRELITLPFGISAAFSALAYLIEAGGF